MWWDISMKVLIVLEEFELFVCETIWSNLEVHDWFWETIRVSLVFKFWFGLGNIIRLSSVSKFVCGIVKEYYVDHKIP